MLYQYKCIFSNRASNFDRGYNCTSLFLADKHVTVYHDLFTLTLATVTGWGSFNLLCPPIAIAQ